MLFDFGIGLSKNRALNWMKANLPTRVTTKFKPKPGHCAVIRHASKDTLTKYVERLSMQEKELPIITYQLAKGKFNRWR